MICTYQTSIRWSRLFGCSRPPYNHHQQSVSQLWCLYKQNQHVNIEYYHINKQLKQTWISAEIRCPMPDQKPMWTRCLGGFCVMWVPKLLISPVKKGFFAPKRPNLAQNWHFWSIWARPCRLIRCPVGGSVGGCGARAVSRKTPIYFIFIPTGWGMIDEQHTAVKLQETQVKILL